MAKKKRTGGSEPKNSFKDSSPPKKPKPVIKESIASAKTPAGRMKLLSKSEEKTAPKPVTNEDISSNWKSFIQVNNLE